MVTNKHSIKGYVGAAAGITGVNSSGVFDSTEFSGKTTPVAADKVVIQDTEASNAPKTVTFANASKALAVALAGTETASALTGSGTTGAMAVSPGGATAKTAPVSADKILICDTEAANANKSVTFANATKALKPNDLTAKTAPVAADEIIIGDTEASNVAKKVTAANLCKAQAATLAGTVTSSALTGNATTGVMAVSPGGATAKTAPVSADLVLVCDTEAANANKSVTTGNLTKALNINGVTAKATPIAADEILLGDTADTNKVKKCTFAQSAKAIAPTLAGVEATNGLTADANGVLTVAAKIAHLEAALLKGMTVIPMSFETGFQMALRVYFPYKVTINKIRGIVTKAIAASDNGTITAANSSGDMASGVVTATASDPLTTAYSVSPTTNNVILADGYVQLTSAKTTPGGEVLVTIEWTRTA